MVRRFKIDISGNKMLLRSDNQGHKETFLCEEYTQPLTISLQLGLCFFSRFYGHRDLMFRRRKLKILAKKRHFIRRIGVNFPQRQ